MPGLQQEIFQICTRLHGLVVSKESLQILLDNLGFLPSQILSKKLDEICKLYKSKESNPILNKDKLEAILVQLLVNEQTDCLQADQGVTFKDISHYFKVIDQVPRLKYCLSRKNFVLQFNEELLGSAQQKQECFRDRFDLIKQSLMKMDEFRPNSFQQQKLCNIKNMVGCPNQNFHLFGMLTQIKQGKIHLEDLDGFVELEFTLDCQQDCGLFCFNQFVLVHGIFTDEKIFKVDSIQMPKVEQRNISLSAIGNLDYFGANFDIKNSWKLEQEADGSVVFVCDVWLDLPLIFTKLKTMFEGFESSPPLAFVFIGSFQSHPFQETLASEYTDNFNHLSDLISQFPKLAKSTFVFVPGPNDPLNGHSLLPRPKIPDNFTRKLRTKLENVVFTSNPCRIKYCTQDIVIFRENLGNRMQRNALLAPNYAKQPDFIHHYVKTIIDQRHLCPVPFNTRPTIWTLDHSLGLYPNPNLLVICDQLDSFQVEYEECVCVNPGMFSNEFKFSFYETKSRKLSQGLIP